MPAKTKTSSTGNSNEGRKKNAPAKSPAAENVANILEELQNKNTPKDKEADVDDIIEITLPENLKRKHQDSAGDSAEPEKFELSEEAKAAFPAAFAYFSGGGPVPKKPKPALGMGLEIIKRTREEQLLQERRLQKENAELRMQQENAALKIKVMEQKQELLTLQLEQAKRDLDSGKDPEIKLQGKKKSPSQDLDLEVMTTEGKDGKDKSKTENSKLMSMMRDMKDTLVQTQLDVVGQTFHWTQTRYICLMAKITTTVLGHTHTHTTKNLFSFLTMSKFCLLSTHMCMTLLPCEMPLLLRQHWHSLCPHGL